MYTKEDEIYAYEDRIERLEKLIEKAKALLDEHYTEKREERYEALLEEKWETESELESLSEDEPDEPDFDLDEYLHRRTYAPMEGFYYG